MEHTEKGREWSTLKKTKRNGGGGGGWRGGGGGGGGGGWRWERESSAFV